MTGSRLCANSAKKVLYLLIKQEMEHYSLYVYDCHIYYLNLFANNWLCSRLSGYVGCHTFTNMQKHMEGSYRGCTNTNISSSVANN